MTKTLAPAVLLGALFLLASVDAGSSEPVRGFTTEKLTVDREKEEVVAESFGLEIGEGVQLGANTATYRIDGTGFPRVIDLEVVRVVGSAGYVLEANSATYYPRLKHLTVDEEVRIVAPTQRGLRKGFGSGSRGPTLLSSDPPVYTCKNGEIHEDGVPTGNSSQCFNDGPGASSTLTCNPTGTGGVVEFHDHSCPLV